MKRLTSLLLIIICLCLTVCQSIKSQKKFEVSATVSEKLYKSSYTTFITIYNSQTKSTTLIPIIHPEQYFVTITYKDISETFDSKSLYLSVKEEDKINMILINYYDGEDNLVKQTLKLPE